MTTTLEHRLRALEFQRKQERQLRKAKPLTAERLRELLDYDPKTGFFIWKSGGGRKIAGGRAGAGRRDRGYRIIGVDGNVYLEHRLAWLFVYGRWPTEIDHINGNPSDSRLENLREATRTQNNANARRSKLSTSGFKGVSFNKRDKVWCAYIRAEGKHCYLGSFKTPEEAHAAYVAAAVKFHGEFARSA